MPPDNLPEDHHFLSVFYLSLWQRGNGPLVEFARRGNGKIEARDSYPKGTGYKSRLYTNEFESDPRKAQALEAEFMSDLDSRAAEALQLFDQKTSGQMKRAAVGRDLYSRFFFEFLKEIAGYKRSYLEFFNKVTNRYLKTNHVPQPRS